VRSLADFRPGDVVTASTNQRGEVVVRGKWTAVFRDRP
jgi:hypothetical protein